MYKSLLSLALVPSLVAARTVNVRRGVDCSFETAASTGDTCDSFSSSWGITVEKLKALNPGQVDCTNFDINKSYCVIGEVNNTPVTTTSSAKPSTTKPTASATPTTKPNTPTQDGIAKDCDKFHKVVSGDQCDAIESKYSISQEQFLKWNPAINAQCTNLALDYYVCVHVPGAQPPTNQPNTPQQPGTAKDCDKFHKVVAGDQCDAIEAKYKISHDEFAKLNPSLDSKCTNLALDYYYCVHNPATKPPTSNPNSPTQPGIAKDCDKYHKVVAGDQCDKIEAKYTITHQEFSRLNPAIDSKCSNLIVDYYVCVHNPATKPAPTNNGPQPQMPNLDKNCKKYHKVQNGEGCFDIDKRYNITLDQFRRWNPSIDAKCSNLWVDYYVCVQA